MREWTFRLTDDFHGLEFSLPHPSLRATFSRWEKEKLEQIPFRRQRTLHAVAKAADLQHHAVHFRR